MAQTNYVGSGPRGNVTWHKSDPDGDLDRLEGWARHALAKIKAKDFTTGPGVTVNSRAISSTLRDSSGKVFVSLDGWAQARNIALNKNMRRGTLAFSHGGRDYVTALGSDQIKVGGSWKSMGAMAVRKDETLYVSLSGIESVVESARPG